MLICTTILLLCFKFRFVATTSIGYKLDNNSTRSTRDEESYVINLNYYDAQQNKTTSRRLAGFLKVQGRQIVDGNGNIVRWRGVNMDCYYWYDVSTRPDAQLVWYASQSDIQYLKNIGVTSIRLALDWTYFDSSLGYDLIDLYLSWCIPLGIYILLDMHIVPPYIEFGQEQIWGNNTAKQQLINLWKTIATRYRDHQWIGGYDLYNEPRPSNAQEWWDLANSIITGIRAVDKKHIIIVESPNYEFQLLNDANIVYSYHDYEPFLVTHAGYSSGQDSPNPKTYTYPGRVLLDTEWVGYSAEARAYTKKSSSWSYFDSGPLRPVANGDMPGKVVEWATVKLSASGTAGDVYFDDVQLIKNGWKPTVTNPGFEKVSPIDPDRPRAWYFWASPDSDYTSGWSTKYRRKRLGNKHSVMLSGTNGFAIWAQVNGYLTAPLFRVNPGDIFRVRGWIYAPNNQGGEISLGLDYLGGVYNDYNATALREILQPTWDWARTNNVPLYVGEFGSLPDAPNDSRNTLLQDKVKIMNEEGLHWSFWTYRTEGFALFQGDVVDKELETILKSGMM